MPQLDKLSFSTQYIWLTFFIVVLYALTAEFFAINVFKSLKLRTIISNFVTTTGNPNLSFVTYQKKVYSIINRSVIEFYYKAIQNVLSSVIKQYSINIKPFIALPATIPSDNNINAI